MNSVHNTVFELQAEAPLAEMTETLFQRWQEGWAEAPSALIRVAPHQHAAFVAHMRARILHLSPQEVLDSSPAGLLRAALDGGATLIAGGQEIQPGLWQPMLFVNSSDSSPHLCAVHSSLPRMTILRTDDSLPSLSLTPSSSS